MHDSYPATGARPDPRATGLRASDQERDQVVALLSIHAAAGRLTLDEVEHRTGQAYAAKTAAELAELLRDLPDPATPSTSGQTRRWFVAVMGSSHRRRRRFRLHRRAFSIAVMASPDIDLCDATIDGDVVIYALALIGSPDIYLPDSIAVQMEGVTVIGGDAEQGSQRPPDPHAPVVTIRSFSLAGGYTVWRLPAQLQHLPYRDARTAARALTSDTTHARLAGPQQPPRDTHLTE